MTRPYIDYGRLMQRAMQRLVIDVLTRVASDGLPGDHHFFITFDTRAEGVDIADWLRDRYPEDMTIVIQHWFEGLDVREHDFSVTLNFGDRPEPLVVPYDAILTFVDPSVEFGLRFESHEAEDDDAEDDGAPVAEMVEDAEDHQDAEVVSLDAFRKH